MRQRFYAMRTLRIDSARYAYVCRRRYMLPRAAFALAIRRHADAMRARLFSLSRATIAEEAYVEAPYATRALFTAIRAHAA